jgi:3-oxoacyl-[acyl-carrier protein] reductase
MANDNDQDLRRVLVTGASGGIGRAIAVALAGDGFDVVVHYSSSEQAAEETAALIEGASSKRPATMQFDVTDRERAGALLEEDIQTNGAYWGVVSNAGTHADAPFPKLSSQAWDGVLATNLDGFYNVVRPMVMPMVRARRGGRIVTISSIAGLAGNRGQANYAAAKAGLIAATKSVAQELAKRSITANSVAPGLIDTGMVDGAPVERILEMIPMKRLGTADEVAAAVSFLFSPGAAYITGQVLSVNGGMY